MIRRRLLKWWTTRQRIKEVEKPQSFMVEVSENDIRSILNEIEAEQRLTKEREE